MTQAEKPRCANCSGEHTANSYACPKVVEASHQAEMKKLSYAEAAKKGADPIDGVRLAACLVEILYRILDQAKIKVREGLLCSFIAEAVTRNLRCKVPLHYVQKHIANLIKADLSAVDGKH
jgi:hypothetical protein